MAQVVQFRRGNTAQVAAYTGPIAEFIVNLTTNRPHLQDGVTPGGHPLALLTDLEGAGAGDMLKATYDPTNKNADAFNMENMSEGSTKKIMTQAERTKLGGIAPNATANSTDAFLLALENSTGDLPASRITGLNAAITGKEDKANKNVANGYAGLDAQGLISTTQLPPLAITDTFEVDDEAEMLALTAQRGDIAIRLDVNKTFILAQSPASTLANWKELRTPTDVVLSVAGLTGAISAGALIAALGLTKADVGLDQVENLSPANLPISNATQAALDQKWGSDVAVIDFGTL